MEWGSEIAVSGRAEWLGDDEVVAICQDELWLDELPEGANCWLAMAYELEELRAKETHPYHIGPLTFDRVFRAGQLDNMADMQAVLDAVERALEAE